MKLLGDKTRKKPALCTLCCRAIEIILQDVMSIKNSNKLRKQLSNFVEENSTGHY